jgi:hypothetical protein
LTAAGTAAQPDVRSDLVILAQDGHILDEMGKDFLAFSINDCRIGPELRQIMSERLDPVPHLGAQLLQSTGVEAGKFFLDRCKLRLARIPFRLEAGCNQSVCCVD